MLNSLIIQGRLTADPELKNTQNGKQFVSVNVAVDRNFVKQGAERQVDFIPVVAWGKTAEFIKKYFKKGQMIILEGSIQTRSYSDKQGNKRTSFGLVVSNVNFAGSKNEQNGTSKSAAQTQPTTNAASAVNTGDNDDFVEIDGDDDLPF